MRMKFVALGVIAISLTILSCQTTQKDGWDVVISGKVGFPSDGIIKLKSWTDTTDGFETVEFNKDNYTFKHTVHLIEPGIYTLNFFDNQFVDIILDKNNLEVNADGNKPNGFFEVIGSPDIDMFKRIQEIRTNVNESPELVKINEQFNEAVKVKDEKRIEELQGQYQRLLYDSIAELLISNSPSIGVIEFLSKNELDPDDYFSVYEKVAESMKGEWSTYQVGKDFIEMVDKMKTVAIGSVAPEIALPNPNGEVVALSSLRGKYVLVDFWAKWCGPCRAENPNVVKAYNRFKDKGFEVFGVSLDRNKKDWVQAIEEDGLKWTQVSDLKYFNSEAARLYNINAIPFSILVDPQGIIIGKNLRGRALESKLEEIFKAI